MVLSINFNYASFYYRKPGSKSFITFGLILALKASLKFLKPMKKIAVTTNSEQSIIVFCS